MTAALIGQRPAISLDRLPRGRAGSVLAVGLEHAFELQREGLVVGARLTVRTAAPLRGPLIVEVGRARLAVARAIAATVLVAPDEVGRP